MTFYKFLAAAKLELLENPASQEHIRALIEREIIAESERNARPSLEPRQGEAVKSALKIQGMH